MDALRVVFKPFRHIQVLCLIPKTPHLSGPDPVVDHMHRFDIKRRKFPSSPIGWLSLMRLSAVGLSYQQLRATPHLILTLLLPFPYTDPASDHVHAQVQRCGCAWGQGHGGWLQGHCSRGAAQRTPGWVTLCLEPSITILLW